MVVEVTECVFVLMTLLVSCQGNGKTCGILFFTVMPENKTFAINWFYQTCSLIPDTIILYEKPPKAKQLKILEKVRVKGRKKGFMSTRCVWNFNNNFPGNWNIKDSNSESNDTCFPYYIKSFKNNKTIHSDCLHIRPDWMKSFGHLRIGQMVIPGTYRSGALKKSNLITPNDHQDIDIWGQLVFGIRYFDLHIEYNETLKRNPNSFNVPQQLKIIKEFLKRSKREILILDFQGFINFADIAHYKVINLLKETFADLIISKNLSQHKLGPKLYDCWKFDKRIIINYRNSKAVKNNYWLWNDIFIKSHFVDNLKQFEEHFKVYAKKHEHKEMVWVLSVGLKTASYKIYDRNISFASNILNNWMIKNDLLDYTNVIAVEFFLSSRVVDNSIEANTRKHYGIF